MGRDWLDFESCHDSIERSSNLSRDVKHLKMVDFGLNLSTLDLDTNDYKILKRRLPLVSNFQCYKKPSYNVPPHTPLLYFMSIITLWHWKLRCVPQLQIFNGWLGGGELNVRRASSCRLLCGTKAYQDCPYNKCVDVFSFALIVQESYSCTSIYISCLVICSNLL
jgi:hypothetical protein